MQGLVKITKHHKTVITDARESGYLTKEKLYHFIQDVSTLIL